MNCFKKTHVLKHSNEVKSTQCLTGTGEASSYGCLKLL